MGIGGGIITRKLLFAVMLVAAMLLTGIAGVSAANVGNAETKINYTHIVPEKVNYQIVGINSTNKSDIKQNTSDKTVKHVKKTVKKHADKQINTLNKNTVKQKTQKKHWIHSKNLTKTNNTVYHNTTNTTPHKSTKTLKHKVTVNSTKNTTVNTEKPEAAAGEPKKVKKTSTTTGKYLAAGSPSTVKIPKSLRKYLKATRNCQVNNARIKSLANQITRGKKTRLGKATAIFNWVRDHVGYKFYYNTRKGAVGTLRAKSGNCVDTAHLLIALERAAGIPARYVHGKAKFRSGKWYGHVWAGVHVNGRWYKADATSSRNSFGVTRNWSRTILKGKYVSLPF